jgi:hypothetical protein
MQDEHNQEMDDLKTNHNSYLKQLNQTHANEIERLTKDREEIRSSKDYKILEMEKSIEQQRIKLENEITRLTIKVRD